MAPQPLPPSSSEPEGELSIMHEILEELDRERSRRAELEAQVRALKRQQDDELTISRKEYAALQTELEGYRELIHAMTQERPAIRQALAASTRQKMVPSEYDNSTSNNTTLPLHVVRVLELIPWDPRAREYACGKEELFEWQFYNAKQKVWQAELGKSPQFFQSLPTEEPQSSESVGNNNKPLLNFLGNESPPPSSSCVLTNHGMTKLYNLHKGYYPLPENGGTWQWVGGWRVEKRAQSTLSRGPDCDDDGWSYAMEATHFLLDPKETCWDNPGQDGKILRPVRRRKWTRQRALVDYPHASESSKSFLNLLAHLAYATTAAHKISQQLVDTKVALTESESVLTQCQEETTSQMRVLEEIRSAKISHPETRAKIVAASDAAHKMQIEITKALSVCAQGKNNNSLS